MDRYEFYSNLQSYQKNSLEHYGIIGQKWGKRRWQNSDGTFNAEGKERYFGSGKSNKEKTKEPKEQKMGSMLSFSRKVKKDFNKGILANHERKNMVDDILKNRKDYDAVNLSDDEIRELVKKIEFPGGQDNDWAHDAQQQFKRESLKYQLEKALNTKFGSNGTDRDMKKAEKEAEKIEKKLSKADWAERREILQKLADDPKFKSMYDEINEKYDKQNEEALSQMKKIFDDYDDQETEHLATAGIMAMLHNGYYPNPTMSDLADCAWFYAYEDGNQGDNTAEYLYATIDKGIRDDELNKLYDQIHVRKDAKEEAKMNLKKDPVLSNLNDRYLDMIVDRKMDDRYADNDGYWKLYAATEGGSRLNEKTKKDYAEAKNISKKLSKSCGNTDGWDYLNQAIENLGLSNTELSNMTQADWDKVNAEVNRLKK